MVFNKWSFGGLFIVVLGWGILLISPFISESLVLSVTIWTCEVYGFSFTLLFDWCSVLFFSVVFIISGSVFIYCEWYMSNEVFYSRFISLVLLFVISMVSLLFISDLVSLLLGWDGLGITSFCLVVYYQNNKSLGAGMITALTNRIGDVFILVSISLLVCEGSWALYGMETVYLSSLVGLILLLASVTNSAQVPFSSWLPAAIAAPTPVSSLVHSSTLVTAGVYLLCRSYAVLSSSGSAIDLLKLMSLFTLVMAGSSALMEIDLNNVIALSTLSQLSIMMFSISIGIPYVGFFHLVSHATFNALLFLCAGAVIHSNFNYQDIRVISQSWRKLPVSSACFMVANLSLCGCPFLSGFYSNDLIIELSIMSGDSLVLYFMLFLGTLFTSLYSFRVGMYVLFGESGNVVRTCFLEENKKVNCSYTSLLISAVTSGYVFSNVNELFVEVICVSLLESVLVFLFIFFCLVGYESWLWGGFIVSINNDSLGYFFNSIWSLNSVFSSYVPLFGLFGAGVVVGALENGWLENWGPVGANDSVSNLAVYNQKFQSFSFLSGFYFVGLISVFLCFFLFTY